MGLGGDLGRRRLRLLFGHRRSTLRLDLGRERGEGVVGEALRLVRAGGRAPVAGEARPHVPGLAVAGTSGTARASRTARAAVGPVWTGRALGAGRSLGPLRARRGALRGRCGGGGPLGGGPWLGALGARRPDRPGLLLLRLPLGLPVRGRPGDVDHRGHELGRGGLLLHLGRRQRAAPDVVAVDVLGVGPAARPALAPHEPEPGVHPAVEVVDEVGDQRLEGHRGLRRPELQLAVVGEHEVDHVLLELAGHAHAPGLLVDPLRGHDQVADQPSLVGVLDAALVAELADLAQVVEEGAGHEQVAVELRVLIGDPVGELDAGHGVLEQPSRVGVVHALRGGRAAQAGDQVVVGQEGLHEFLHVDVGDGLDEADQLGPGRVGGIVGRSLLRLARLGRRHPGEVGGVDPGDGGIDLDDRLEAELRLALEGADGALDLDQVLLLEEGRELLDTVEGAGLDLPRAVHQGGREVALAALGGRHGLASHREDGLHALAFLHVLDPGLLHGPRKLTQEGFRDNRGFRSYASRGIEGRTRCRATRSAAS